MGLELPSALFLIPASLSVRAVLDRYFGAESSQVCVPTSACDAPVETSVRIPKLLVFRMEGGMGRIEGDSQKQ